MKINIRRNCFETNSSSMHSIVVTDENSTYSEKELLEDMYIWKDGKFDIWNDNDLYFGRSPFRILTTFSEKLCYAIASLCGGYTEEEEADRNFEMLENIAKKHVPTLKTIKLPEKREPIFLREDGTEISSTGVWPEDDDEFYYHKNNEKERVIRSDYDNVSPEYGYIDHQSSGLLQGFLRKNDISIEDFLTCKKYYVIIDGDEYCEWDKLKLSGLLNKERIVKEYPDSGYSYDYEKYLEKHPENDSDIDVDVEVATE